jgi:hypothetical protein
MALSLNRKMGRELQMKQMNKRWLFVGAAVVTAALLAAPQITSAAAPSGASSSQQRTGAVPLTGQTLFKAFSTGADGGTTYRISTTGNVFSAESPAGFEHIEIGTFIEGYVLCYTPSGGSQVNAWDDDNTESGFGAATDALGPPVSVTRKTSDNKLQLRQVYTFNASGKALKIVMSVKNLTASTVSGVTLRRVVDFDIDNSLFNDFARTLGSIFAWNDTTGHGMVLQHLGGPSRSARVYNFTNESLVTVCDAASDTTPILGTDGIGSIDYNLGNIAAGATKSATVAYVRI